jgi:glycosyltransferase involved in cell wall biosynthesis
MSSPAISVLLPVHDAGPYLEAALRSVLQQSFTDFEIVAIDDGSTDGSGATLDRVAAADPRLRPLHRENRGLVATLNQAIALARAPLLARMDADDLCRPDRLALQLARMQADPGLVALGGQPMLIDPDGRPLLILPMPLDHHEIDARHLLGRDMGICHPTVMIRRSAIEAIGGYDAGYRSAEDYDLWLRLAEVGRLANLPQTVLDYRQHFASVGYTRRREQADAAWRAARAAAARRGLDFRQPEPGGDGPGPQSETEVFRRWGWWALGGGQVATARHYAAKALRRTPLAPAAWRLAYCALRGR